MNLLDKMLENAKEADSKKADSKAEPIIIEEKKKVKTKPAKKEVIKAIVDEDFKTEVKMYCVANKITEASLVVDAIKKYIK